MSPTSSFLYPHTGVILGTCLPPNTAQRPQEFRVPSSVRKQNIRVLRGPPPEHSGPPEAWNPGRPFPSEGLNKPAVLPVGRHATARRNSIFSDQETQNLSFHGNRGACRNGAGVSPTRRVPQNGHVRCLSPEAPTQATATRWGCESRWFPTLPGPGPALRPPPQLQPEARRGPTASEARYLGWGWGRDGGQGSGKRAERRQGSCSRENFHQDETRSEKENSAGEGGRGEKPGSGRRKRQGERDLARCTNSREMAPESRDHRRPLSSRGLRPQQAEWVWSSEAEVTCMGCARGRGQVHVTSVPPRGGRGEWFSVVGVVLEFPGA